MLQLDGSYHDWFEERGPWLTLLLAVDDATGTAPYALFREREDTRGYLSLLQGIIESKGIPLSVHTDGHAVFQSRRDFSEVAVGCSSTQWGRALGELDITPISAHSPEAKGRVKRANGTFQDRLVSELRLVGATTLSEANDVLADFLPRFNQRFGVAAAQPDAVYRPLDPGLDLAGVLCADIVDDKLSQTKGESIPPQIAPSCRRLHAPRCGSETCKVYPGRHSH